MSRSGQDEPIDIEPLGVFLGPRTMPHGLAYAEHRHPVPQLAWAAAGVLSVVAGTTTWVLPPTRALWIPAGVPHVTRASTTADMHGVYLPDDRCPDHFVPPASPTVFGIGVLTASLLAHLADSALTGAPRTRAEAVLFDQLSPSPTGAVELPWPSDSRARAIADALATDPADERDIAAWGRTVGAAGRTVARLFVRDTGLGFGRWRTRLRMQRACELLAAGEPVGRVAARVGYLTTSAFVAACRRELGATPAKLFTRPVR